jgi:outer membrane protein insertion porin family
VNAWLGASLTWSVLAIVLVGAPVAAQPPDESTVPQAQPAADTGSLPHAGTPGPDNLAPAVEADVAFGPRFVVEAVVIRGLVKTDEALVRRELGFGPGDVLTGDDPRVEEARLRLRTIGYFLDVRFSQARGSRRGAVVVVIDVVERGTAVISALHLGTSEATAFWGGLEVVESNFLGRGINLGGGFVASTTPRVANSVAGRALSFQAAGSPPRGDGLVLSGHFFYNEGSEFFRTGGSLDDADPDNFAALTTRRAGGGLGVGMELSRTTRLSGEARLESIDARLPGVRTRQTPAGETRPISFGVRQGASTLAALGVTLDVDRRSDPVLPNRGARLFIALEAASPALGGSYTYARGLVRTAVYVPVGRRGHALGFHGLAGGVFGDAPYFERFFIGDLNLLLAPRALGLNFSTQPSRDFLGTSIEEKRYGAFAARAMVDYAIPILRRGGGFVYRGDAFIGLGAFALADAEDLRVRDTSLRQAIPVDLTGDLGVRLDTYIGIFTLSIANAIGRLPF